jgi:hypothetical protein
MSSNINSCKDDFFEVFVAVDIFLRSRNINVDQCEITIAAKFFLQRFMYYTKLPCNVQYIRELFKQEALEDYPLHVLNIIYILCAYRLSSFCEDILLSKIIQMYSMKIFFFQECMDLKQISMNDEQHQILKNIKKIEKKEKKNKNKYENSFLQLIYLKLKILSLYPDHMKFNGVKEQIQLYIDSIEQIFPEYNSPYVYDLHFNSVLDICKLPKRKIQNTILYMVSEYLKLTKIPENTQYIRTILDKTKSYPYDAFKIIILCVFSYENKFSPDNTQLSIKYSLHNHYKGIDSFFYKSIFCKNSVQYEIETKLENFKYLYCFQYKIFLLGIYLRA